MLTSSSYFLVLYVFGNGFQGYLLQCFPRDWSKTDEPVVTQIFLTEDKSDVYYLPFLRNLLVHDSLSKIIKIGLTETWVSFLSTCGCVPLGPTDLSIHPVLDCTSSLFKCSLTCSSSSKDNSSLLQTFLVVGGAWDSSRQILSVKSEAEKTLSTSVFFMSVVTRSPAIFSSRLTFTLIFLLQLVDS